MSSYEYRHYPYTRPPELDGKGSRRPVVIVGAGIAGPTLAENSDVVGPRLALTRRDAGIPEPETYALMIAGLAAIGVVRRRRPPGTA